MSADPLPGAPESLEEYNARKNAEARAAWESAHPDTLKGISTMPHIDQMTTSKFLSKADVATPVNARIRAIVKEVGQARNAGPGAAPEERWMMYFDGFQKGLKLNKTILTQIAASYGPQTEAWIGRAVRLYHDPSVMFAGQLVGGVRVQCARPRPPAAGAPTVQGHVPPQASAGQPQQAQHIPQNSVPLAAPPPADWSTAQQQWQPQPAGAPLEEEFDDEIPF